MNSQNKKLPIPFIALAVYLVALVAIFIVSLVSFFESKGTLKVPSLFFSYFMC